jgi:hypothetical protein
MKQKLDEYRAEIVRQLEHEQVNRDTRAIDLQAGAAKLAAENDAALLNMGRAKEPMSASDCPRCWIWDGETRAMEAKTDVDGVRFFQCVHCDYTLEAQIV